MKYNLGKKNFKTKKDITTYVKALLNKLDIGQQVLGDDLELITDLISWHPEKEMKEVVANKISVEENDYGHRHFVLNGEPFSYIKCIKGGSEEKNKRSNVLKACRQAIQYQIDAYLEQKKDHNGFYTCEKTGETMLDRSDIHVDHNHNIGKQFLTIVEEFIINEKLSWNNIPLVSLDNGGWSLDDDVASRFQSFHEKEAKLRVIVKLENLKAKKATRLIPMKKRNVVIEFID